MSKLVIFTDLDGTLLDQAYSLEAARPALRLVAQLDIPLVICSSKTRLEIERYRRLLNNNHPFIAENGGGIFVPADYFGFELNFPGLAVLPSNDYITIKLGAPYSILREAMNRLRERGFNIRGFGDMTVEEVSQLTGLSLEEVALAKAREFDEPFVLAGEERDLFSLLSEITSMGLRSTRGTLLHLLGDSDKGRAVSILVDAYRRRYGEVVTIALGDSENDLPMLREADRAVIIRKPDGRQVTDLFLRRSFVTDEPGPAGWNKAVAEIVKRYVGS